MSAKSAFEADHLQVVGIKGPGVDNLSSRVINNLHKNGLNGMQRVVFGAVDLNAAQIVFSRCYLNSLALL